jgi:deazaflavin-dependent oxidoreductase (nitroreductase family)
MTGNDFMAWVLRSPFHGMLSNGMMLITITGRKTGRKYTTPVGFYREGDYLWVITRRKGNWWKNLQGGAQVDLLMKRKPVRALAEIEQEEQAVAARMPEYLQHIPMAAKQMEIRMEDGKPNAEDIARTAKERVFVRLKVD